MIEISRRQALQATGGLVVAGLAATTLTGCAGAALAAGELAAPSSGWLSDFAVGVGASQVSQVITESVQWAWREWRSSIHSSENKQGNEGFPFPGPAGYGHPVPPVVFFSVAKQQSPDPTTDRLICCMESGGWVQLSSWAWQGLAGTVKKVVADTKNMQKTDLTDYAAKCLLPGPLAARSYAQGHSPDWSSAWISYRAKEGTVVLVTFKEANGDQHVRVTANGLARNADGSVQTFSFKLQTPTAYML